MLLTPQLAQLVDRFRVAVGRASKVARSAVDAALLHARSVLLVPEARAVHGSAAILVRHRGAVEGAAAPEAGIDVHAVLRRDVQRAACRGKDVGAVGLALGAAFVPVAVVAVRAGAGVVAGEDVALWLAE